VDLFNLAAATYLEMEDVERFKHLRLKFQG